jgi:15,16-dihydrobiliverdin:ferredoxin oxidoreductase
VKPAKIGNLCFRGGNFRKIRVTYFDAGDGVQVFNTLWYPKYEYDIPLLGIDLISLGTSRVLTVIDTQPLYPTEEYNQKYIAGFKGIRDKYPDLQGVLSGKIYDDTSFFSKQMLFGRFTDESKVRPVVYPAFEEYLNAYLNLAEGATPNHDARAIDAVKARQTEYDKYSALKDPAVGLFDAYFGKEWSHSFVHDFLFDLSDSLVKDSAPVHNFQIAGPTISAGNNPLVSAPPVTQKAKVQSPLLSIISRIKAPLVFGISQSIADASAYAALPPAEHQ